MYEQTVVILFRFHGAAHPQVCTLYTLYCVTTFVCTNMYSTVPLYAADMLV